MPHPVETTSLGPSDAELLADFARKGRQEAFTALLQRHGRMVLSVCRSVLGDTADADDALSVHVRAALAEALGAPRRDWMAKKLTVLIACAEAVEAAPEPLPEAEVLARGLARLPVTARAPASEPAPTAPAAGREPLLRVTFTRRRGADAVVLRVTQAVAGQPAYRRVGALAISHESPADAKGFARLVELVAAAASRTPPALDDAEAWRARLEGLLETTHLDDRYRLDVRTRPS